MDALEVIIQHIIDNNLCVQKDVDIFKDYRPDDVDNLVSVHQALSYGYHRMTGMNTRRIQIVTRNLSVRQATILSNKLFDIFDTAEETLLMGETEYVCHVKSTPTKRLIDDKGRCYVQFDINLVVNNRL